MSTRKSKFEGQFKAGDKFSHWTVVDGVLHNSPPKIDVQCVCGKIKRVNLYSLRAGKSESCGCQVKGENARRYTGVRGFDMNGTSIYRSTLRAANLYGSVSGSFTNTDAKYLYQSQKGVCAVTGQTLNSSTARLEAISSSQPISLDNAQWVHTSISPLVFSSGGTHGFVNLVNSITLNVTEATHGDEEEGSKKGSEENNKEG